jgi:hypothetical protein
LLLSAEFHGQFVEDPAVLRRQVVLFSRVSFEVIKFQWFERAVVQQFPRSSMHRFNEQPTILVSNALASDAAFC